MNKDTLDENRRNRAVCGTGGKEDVYKRQVLDILDSYNQRMRAEDQDDKVISYTDMTGMLMSSVTEIVDTVSYVLIAFVATSLVVSSITVSYTHLAWEPSSKEKTVSRKERRSKREKWWSGARIRCEERSKEKRFSTDSPMTFSFSYVILKV